MTEKQRRAASLFGLALWFAYPFAFAAQSHANWEQQCGGREFTGTFDGCFNDALPVFEIGAPILTLLLVYPFARLSFSMFGPDLDERSDKWRMAAVNGGGAYYPAFQVAAAIGAVWALLHLISMPFATRYWYLIAYWFVWTGWFLLGAFASLPNKPAISASGS